MGVSFEYKNAGSTRFGPVLIPMAKVSFKSPTSDRWSTTWLIVDTGADITILPKPIAKDLLINLESDCWKEETLGVGGAQTIYLCKVRIKIKIDNIERFVPVAFINNNYVPPLLGRQGFLETFDVEFLKSHSVVFKP